MGKAEAPGRVDAVLALRLLALLAAVSAALSVVSVRRVVRWLTPATAGSARDMDEVRRVVRHLDGLLRRAPFLPYGYCLLRSLTLYYFCTRLGFSVRISFGVRGQPGGTLDAHGWLELDGHPFMERGTPDLEFITMWRLPSATPGPEIEWPAPSLPPPAVEG